MSRSSEIRTQRYKASRQRQQLQQDLLQEQQRQEEDEEDSTSRRDFTAVNPDNVLPLNNPNDHHNMLSLLVATIKTSHYYKARVCKIANYNDLVDEIYLKVTHLDAFEPDATQVTHEKKPSPAFCLLYRALDMKLTKKQMFNMLQHRDSPFIRCLGALYLRFVAVPDQLFDWLGPMLLEDDEVIPGTGKLTVREWAKHLLLGGVRYKDTILPRIPLLVEKAIQAKLAAAATSSSSSSPKEEEEEKVLPGTLCRAKYSEDGKWYEARIEEPSADKPGHFWVTYLPEDEYGNQEEVSLENIRFKGESEEAPAVAAKRLKLEEKREETKTSNEPPLTKYDDL